MVKKLGLRQTNMRTKPMGFYGTSQVHLIMVVAKSVASVGHLLIKIKRYNQEDIFVYHAD